MEHNKLANWLRANKMSINVSKTTYILFHVCGKRSNMDSLGVVFDSNEVGSIPNPNLISKLERIHDNHPNENLISFKLLGVFFDENLSFNRHSSSICAKLNRSIFCMKRASNFLSSKTLRSLYFSTFHSHLIYCSIILSCTSASNLTAIGKIQKKAIRTMNKSNYNAHTGPLFLANKILPFDKLILQNKFLFFYC
jgi:hypothetical protein